MRWFVRIRILRISGIYKIVTMLCIVFTLTFDSSPIKGEGMMLRIIGWIADQVQNDGSM